MFASLNHDAFKDLSTKLYLGDRLSGLAIINYFIYIDMSISVEALNFNDAGIQFRVNMVMGSVSFNQIRGPKGPSNISPSASNS